MDLSLDCKIKQLVQEGRTATEIAGILGMNPFVIRRKCTELDITPAYSSDAMPYGITDSSYALRMALASALIDMDEKGLNHREISEVTGLSRRQISSAKIRPYRHDWTLSQIERTLTHVGQTLKEVL